MPDFEYSNWGFCGRYQCGQGVTNRLYSYNTWPLMNGQVIPDGLVQKDQPYWRNFFENVAMVQFNHRNMAYLTMFASYFLLYRIMKARIGGPTTVAGLLVVLLINYQAFSGIITLLNLVPR
jgi:cytochrome c oxidase assembly protein subunit 15